MTNKTPGGMVKDLQGLLSDDGSAFDRMNAGQGGEAYPPWLRTLADRLKQEGVTDETVVDWIQQNQDKMRALITAAKRTSQGG